MTEQWISEKIGEHSKRLTALERQGDSMSTQLSQINNSVKEIKADMDKLYDARWKPVFVIFTMIATTLSMALVIHYHHVKQPAHYDAAVKQAATDAKIDSLQSMSREILGELKKK